MGGGGAALLWGAKTTPGSSIKKNISTYRKPRRLEGFGIRCQILCIIKQPPPTQSTQPPPCQRDFHAAVPLRQEVLVTVPQLALLLDTDDTHTQARFLQSMTLFGLSASSISVFPNWPFERRPPRKPQASSVSCLCRLL